jgi:membrane fusion protein, multidrug efflux system
MKFLQVYLILAVIFSSVFSGCSHNKNNQEVKMTNADSVEAFLLKKGQINKQVIFPAELTPLSKAEIYTKVSGYISEFKADIGDHVKKGDVLALLDAPEVLSNYSQVYAEKQTAYSKYLTTLDTYKRILRASNVRGTVAAEEMEKSKNLMLSDSSALEAAKSKLNATAQLKDYLTIRAPFSGIITQRNFDQGTLVGANNTKPLLIIESIEKLRLRVPVPEAYTMAIPDTSVIHFTVDAQPGKIYTAQLSRKSGSVNLVNRTELWEYIYQNEGNELKSGMFATASLRFRRKELSFMVPQTALVTSLERRFVIRLKQSKAELVDVKSGITQDDKTEVFGNLSGGDTLLVRGTDEIKTGTKLIVKMKK